MVFLNLSVQVYGSADLGPFLSRLKFVNTRFKANLIFFIREFTTFQSTSDLVWG